jgi:hypothetical protein
LESLRDAWKGSKWAQDNCLIAVAGSGRDGTPGLQGDAGQWEATRRNIEGFAHIIFTANPNQINFYLGKGAATLADLDEKWGGRKPCLHGSDAHEADRVGLPDHARRCWLNGDLTFETLRQAVMTISSMCCSGLSGLPSTSTHATAVEAIVCRESAAFRSTRSGQVRQ